MGDHFVLMVDRLLTESTIGALIGNHNQLDQTTNLVNNDKPRSASDEMDKSPTKLVQCRICHDEEQSSNMETPCSCSGTLEFAHRICVQRWCNEKGDIICEICRQQFKPGYSAPRRLFRYGGFPMNFTGNWGISGFHLHNPELVAQAANDDDLFDTEFEDDSVRNSGSLMCCRVIAILFMTLLLLRHTLPVILGGNGDFPISVFMLLLLRTIGVVLPVYILVKLFIGFQRRRHQQDPRFAIATSDEENEVDRGHEPQSVTVH